MSVFVVLLSLFLFSVCVDFPLYKQCDPKWANDTMGVPGHTKEDDTICHQGCAMSSTSMALAGFKFELYGSLVTPGSLNKWLRDNDGYHCVSNDCCNLVLDSPDKIDPSKIRCLGEPLVPFLPTLKKLLNDGIIIIAHVRDQHHFVLLTGLVKGSEDEFYVNDPGFDQKTYKYSDIHDVILYDII